MPKLQTWKIMLYLAGEETTSLAKEKNCAENSASIHPEQLFDIAHKKQYQAIITIDFIPKGTELAPLINTDHFSELDGDGMSAPKGHAGGILPLIKQRMKSAIAAAVPPLSRAQLVDRMNEIAERENLKITVSKGPLTPAILDKWLAPREPDLPPLPAMSVFMQALGDFGLLEALAEFHGFRLLSPEEALFYEFGKAKFEKREQSRRIKRLEESIMENRKRGR